MASEDLAPWAARIYDSLPESGMTTTGKIFNWLTQNSYKLNAAFGTSYAYNGSGIEPTITSNHSGIYEEFYRCQLWRDQAVRFLGANAYDLDLTETSLEGQSRQRFVSRNERAKNYRLEAKDCEERLKLLIYDIDQNDSSGPLAAQILFSDRQHMQYGDNLYCPPREYWSENNTIFSKYYTFE